ncbi:MAG: hypothetical protein NVS2B16_14070 [Chloroflexota bacterium]
MASAFQIRSCYWPSRVGTLLWREARHDDVRWDFEAVATSGIDSLDVSLLWPDVQPERGRVSVAVLNRLEQVLDIADESHLRLRVRVLPMRVGLDTWVPDWALLPGMSTGTRTVTGTARTNRQACNPFKDHALRTLQVDLVAQVTRAFDQHPAIASWVLGDRIVTPFPGVSAREVGDWLGEMIEVYRRIGGRHPVWHGFSAHDIVHRPLSDLGLEGAGMRVLVAADCQPVWATNGDDVWLAFLAFITTHLTRMPVELADVYTPDSLGYEKAAATLEAVYRAGASGCVAESLFDYNAALKNMPPYDRDSGQLQRGLLRTDGAAKPVSEAWVEARGRPVLEVSGAMIDAEYHARDPEKATRQYYLEFRDSFTHVRSEP